MDTPLISVILPTYNGSRYIKTAIESVLAQNYLNFELIVINDTSTDSTSDLVEEYMRKDKRVIMLKNEKNLRLVGTLNRWIAFASGEYIARIDDDDIWSDSEKLTKQVREFEKNPKLWIVGTQGLVIDDDGRRTGGKIDHAISASAVRWEFWLRNWLIHPSILAKKAVLMQAWLYRSEWLYVEDFDLWLRVLDLGYEVTNISDRAVEYRVRSGSTTGKKYHKMQWLTFLRLFHEKSVYPSRWRKFFCLSIRFTLVVIPLSVIRFIK